MGKFGKRFEKRHAAASANFATKIVALSKSEDFGSKWFGLLSLIAEVFNQYNREHKRKYGAPDGLIPIFAPVLAQLSEHDRKRVVEACLELAQSYPKEGVQNVEATLAKMVNCKSCGCGIATNGLGHDGDCPRRPQ